MDIKYKITKLQRGKIEVLKDSVSVEEPLEMNLKFQSNGKLVTNTRINRSKQ